MLYNPSHKKLTLFLKMLNDQFVKNNKKMSTVDFDCFETLNQNPFKKDSLF